MKIKTAGILLVISLFFTGNVFAVTRIYESGFNAPGIE